MGHATSRKFSRVMGTIPSPGSVSLPSLAKTLFHETPIDTVSPISDFTRSDISLATSMASPPNSCSDPVTSIHDSSRPNGSTKSV